MVPTAPRRRPGRRSQWNAAAAPLRRSYGPAHKIKARAAVSGRGAVGKPATVSGAGPPSLTRTTAVTGPAAVPGPRARWPDTVPDTKARPGPAQPPGPPGSPSIPAGRPPWAGHSGAGRCGPASGSGPPPR